MSAAKKTLQNPKCPIHTINDRRNCPHFMNNGYEDCQWLGGPKRNECVNENTQAPLTTGA